MVIGSLFFRRQIQVAFLIVPAFFLPAFRLVADDQIVKKDGSVITGTITGVSDGQVMVQSITKNGGIAKVPYYITDIKSVSMPTPPDVTKAEAQGVAPAAVITALEPAVKQFAGLPADWVVSTMSQLAQAYAAQGQADRAMATYNQIDTLYPGSKYHAQAVAGKAAMSLKAGKIDEALATIQPIVDQANQDIAPSPADGAMYANAFLVYGQVLEAQKKPRQALEAYLTVTTMFYQNPNLVERANHFADDLRTHNPGIGIE
jgi:tetratricopeptide (TPR) repeat protein